MSMHQLEPGEVFRVVLFESDVPGVSRLFVHVALLNEKNLLQIGYFDIGPAVEERFGDSDLEWDLYLAEPEQQELARALKLDPEQPGWQRAVAEALKERFPESRGFHDIRKFLTRKKIAFEEFMY